MDQAIFHGLHNDFRKQGKKGIQAVAHNRMQQSQQPLLLFKQNSVYSNLEMNTESLEGVNKGQGRDDTKTFRDEKDQSTQTITPISWRHTFFVKDKNTTQREANQNLGRNEETTVYKPKGGLDSIFAMPTAPWNEVKGQNGDHRKTNKQQPSFKIPTVSWQKFAKTSEVDTSLEQTSDDQERNGLAHPQSMAQCTNCGFIGYRYYLKERFILK